MPLFKKQLANPKWIRAKKKKKWWEQEYPKKGISRTTQHESTYERDHAGYGSFAALIFGCCVFGFMIVLVYLFNWIGENYL